MISIVYVTCSPVPLVTARNPPCESPAHETRYPDDNQWAVSTSSQHEGLEVCAQFPAIAPLLNPYEDPLASSLIAAQSQPHRNLNNMPVPEAQGLDPMDQLAPPHSSGVEQQQTIPHNYTERIDSHDNFADASPMSSGSSDEMSDDEWTGTLNLKGTRVPVRALMAKAVGNPYVHTFVNCVLVGDLYACRKLSGFPKELEVELSVGPKLSTLAIQAWIRQNKTPMVQLSPATASCKFDQLVEGIRDHGVSRPSYLLPPLATSRFLTVRSCDVEKQGSTSPRAAWQSPPLCCIPGKRNHEKTDAPTASEGSHSCPHTNSQKRWRRNPSQEGKPSENPKAKVPTHWQVSTVSRDIAKVL